MTTTHETAAQAVLDQLMSDPAGAQALQVYVAGIRQGRWDDDYLDAINQQHPGGGWPLDQVAAFMIVHSDLCAGNLAQVRLGTAGNSPSADRARDLNAAALSDLPHPFVAEVDLAQNNGDADGRLRWLEPICMEVSTGSAVDAPDGSVQPVKKVVTVPPGSVPLEIGTTLASTTLLHCRHDRGVARWPYGHKLIRLFVDVGEPWQRRLGL